MIRASGIECRVWEGQTDKGVRVAALIPRLAAVQPEDGDLTDFEAELQEHSAPSAEIECWPLRMIL